MPTSTNKLKDYTNKYFCPLGEDMQDNDFPHWDADTGTVIWGQGIGTGIEIRCFWLQGYLASGASTEVSTPGGILTAYLADGSDFTIPDVDAAIPAYHADNTADEIPFNEDICFDSILGGRIGKTASQKIGFWGKTPIVQPSGAAQVALTNSTGGTADGTMVAISGSGADTNINNNFTELYTLLNAVRTALVDSGLMKGAA